MMIKNNAKLAFRNLRRRPGFAMIYILGLAIGMACCGLMMLYVHHELSYDAFHENAGRIWRISTEIENGGQVRRQASMPLPMLKHLTTIPAIEAVAELGAAVSPYFRYQDEWVRQEGVASASANVFDMFSYPMVLGNPQTALVEPQSIVLTQSLARKYFGDANPLGQTVETTENVYTVTGVIEDVPANTHWPFEALMSQDRSGPFAEILANRWGFSYTHAYVLTSEVLDVAGVESQLNRIAANDQDEQTYSFHLQPLQQIHLESHLDSELSAPGNPVLLTVFSAIAAFVLIIACVNYINLATAQASRRVQEIGVRKVVGASRRNLVVQLFAESLLVVLSAGLLAFIFVETTLPVFNRFVERHIELEALPVKYLWGGMGGLVLLVGFLAGSYPAILVSAFRPAQLFQQRVRLAGGGFLRKGLVIFQFTLCMTFVIGTGIFYSQYRYMLQKDLGFRQDNILSISTQSTEFAARYEVFKQRLSRYADVDQVTASMGQPGVWAPDNQFRPDSTQSDRALAYHWLGIDYDFVETFGIEVVQGRDLSPAIVTDETEGFLINESAAHALGLREPLGHELQLELNDREGRVVGVFKDFHHGPLQEAITPMILHVVDDVFYSDVLVRVESGTLEESIDFIEAEWKALFPSLPFEYTFFEDRIAEQYAVENRMGTVAALVSLLAVFIACMGLLGMVLFVAETRTKEIGIRKVLGASVSGIVALLSMEYIRLVGIAFIVAAPIVYFSMKSWLEHFAYRIDIPVSLFIAAGALVFALAVLTVSYQSIKAALTNPVEALRYE